MLRFGWIVPQGVAGRALDLDQRELSSQLAASKDWVPRRCFRPPCPRRLECKVLMGFPALRLEPGLGRCSVNTWGICAFQAWPVGNKEGAGVSDMRGAHSKNRVCFQTWLSCREGLWMLWGQWGEAARRQVSSQVLLSDSHLPRGARARPWKHILAISLHCQREGCVDARLSLWLWGTLT